MNFRILLAAGACLLASAAFTFAQGPRGFRPNPGNGFNPAQSRTFIFGPTQPGPNLPATGVVPNLGGQYQGAPGSALPSLGGQYPGSSLPTFPLGTSPGFNPGGPLNPVSPFGIGPGR